MHAVHAPAPRRMGRQPGIVVSFLNEVLRPSPLVIEPHQQVNGILQVGHEHSVAVLGTIEQLILLAFGLALLLLIAQGNKAVRLAPALDRKSTRLNSSHSQISYAVFCLKKKKN